MTKPIRPRTAPVLAFVLVPVCDKLGVYVLSIGCLLSTGLKKPMSYLVACAAANVGGMSAQRKPHMSMV